MSYSHLSWAVQLLLDAMRDIDGPMHGFFFCNTQTSSQIQIDLPGIHSAKRSSVPDAPAVSKIAAKFEGFQTMKG